MGQPPSLITPSHGHKNIPPKPPPPPHPSNPFVAFTFMQAIKIPLLNPLLLLPLNPPFMTFHPPPPRS